LLNQTASPGSESSESQTGAGDGSRALGTFAIILLVVAVLRLVIGMVSIPVSLVAPVSVIVSVVFVGAPILGLFSAARYPWSFKRALIFLVVGVAIWYGSYVGAMHVAEPMIGGLLIALSQSGLIVWCFAIGSLLALVLKDKNLILPIAVFLALFDMWLVFAPEGLVQRSVVQGQAETLRAVAYQVPEVRATSAGGRAAAMLYVGPADYLFISMFFVALYRFRMRTVRTLKVIVPVLGVYLLTVLLFSGVHVGPISLGALPALLPIGLVVLIVNRDQFNLNRDEKLVTWFIAIAGTAFITWRILQPLPPPQVETLPSSDDSEWIRHYRLPGIEGPSRPLSGSGYAPGSTPGLP